MPTNSRSASTDEALGTSRPRLARARRVAQSRRPTATPPMWARARLPPKPASMRRRSSKEPATYEHVAPERVGNKRKLLVSDQSGRSNVLAELDRIGLAVDKNDPRVMRLLDEVKEREAIGYAYEAADASFELLARRMLGQLPHYFEVENSTSMSSNARTPKAKPITVSQAVVKLKVGDEELISGRRRHRAGQCARCRAAQGSRQISALHHRARTHRLSRAYPQRRHPSRDPRFNRKRGRDWRSLRPPSASPPTSSTPRSRR